MTQGELHVLAGLVQSGETAQIVLVGAVGSGRSRTLAELAETVRAQGWRVTLLRPSVDDTRDQRTAAQALGAAPAAHGRKVGHDEFVAALVQAWTGPAADPHLICIDDVDLFDEPLLRAICAAARRVTATLVLTALSEQRLVTGLPGARFQQLGLWKPARIHDVIRRAAGQGPIPEVLDRLASLAGGNPGAAEALTASMTEAQLLGSEPMLPVGFRVPLRVRFTCRVSRDLWPAALLLACAPGTAPAVLIRAGSRLGAHERHFDALERAGLAENRRGTMSLVPLGLGFAVEAVSATGECGRTHAALADAYTGVDDPRALWHRAQAAGEPDAELARRLEQLRDEVPPAGGWSRASQLLQKAAELSADTAVRGRRLAVAAECAWLEGAPALALRLVREAEDLSADPDLRLRIAYVRGSIELAAGAEERALRVMIEAVPPALERLPPHESSALLLRACDAAMAAGDIAAAVGLGRRAQARLATTTADSVTSVRLRLVAGTAKVLAEDLDSGIGLIEEVLAACSQQTDQSHMLVGIRASLLAGDMASMAGYADLAADRLRESGERGLMPFITSRRALANVLFGRLRSAFEITTSGIEESALLGQDNALAEHLAVQALAHARAGNSDDTKRAADSALRLAGDYGLAWPGAMAVWALGELELSAGNPERALEWLTLLWHGSRHERHPLVATLAAAEMAEAAVRAGRPNEGDVALQRLVAWARATGSAAAAGLVERCTALRAADSGETAEAFRRALVLHREADRPFDEARTALAYGAWLRRERRKSECRVHLRVAHERFESIGAATWQANAAQEARASGDAALRREVSWAGVHLTSQETTIARMVADGESNRQVAEKLSLSIRTVEYHLRNVFLKLGIRTRTELAAQRQLLSNEHNA